MKKTIRIPDPTETGRKSEARLARKLGATLTAASGAVAGFKGDMSLPGFLIEAKSTTKDSVSVKLDWLLKIVSEARSKGKDAALSVSFVTPDGRNVTGGDWVMLPMHVFIRLQEDV